MSIYISKTTPPGRGIKLLTRIINHINGMLEKEKLPARWIADIGVIDSNPSPHSVAATIKLKLEYENQSVYEISMCDTDLATTILTTSLLWGKEKTPFHLFAYFLCTTVNLLAITKIHSERFSLLSLMNYTGGLGTSASLTLPTQEKYFLFTYFNNKKFTHLIGKHRHHCSKQYLPSNFEKPCSNVFDVYAMDIEYPTQISSIVTTLVNSLQKKRCYEKLNKNFPLPPSAMLFPQRLINLILPALNKLLKEWNLPLLAVDPTLYIYPCWWGEIEGTNLQGITARLGVRMYWEQMHHAPRIYVPLVGGKISITLPASQHQSITKTFPITTTTLRHIELKILATILLLSFLEYINKEGKKQRTFVADTTSPAFVFLTDRALPIGEELCGVGTHLCIYTDSSYTEQAVGSVTFALPDPSTLGIAVYNLSQGTVRFAFFNTQEILQSILSQSYEIWGKVLNILQLMLPF